jgi:hypothetical protein
MFEVVEEIVLVQNKFRVFNRFADNVHLEHERRETRLECERAEQLALVIVARS